MSCHVYIELSMRKNYHFHRRLNFNLLLGVKNHSQTSHRTTPQNTDMDNLDFITNYIGHIYIKYDFLFSYTSGYFVGSSYNHQKKFKK